MTLNLIKYGLFVSFLMGGCSSPKSNPEIEDLFPLPTAANLQKIEIGAIDIEPFPLDSVESSYLGYLEMNQDTIYQIDEKFCWMFRFTKDGRLIDRRLGIGQGPKEYECGSIDGYSLLSDGRWVFFDSGNGCNFYTNNLDKQNRLQIIMDGSREDKSYENIRMYTKDYGNLIIKQLGDCLYYNVVGYEGMYEDFMSNTTNYFRQVHVLMKMNMKTGQVECLLGGYPSLYERKHAVFQQVSFDIDPIGERFFVSYDADSLVYCYDKDYKPLYAFGWQGRNMKVDYDSYSWETLLKQRTKIRSKYSYYCNIKYVKELDLLFRPYKKDLDSDYDGLQIYRGQTLIGDMDVPRGMTILGYSAPYVYGTTGMDGMRESIDMFRFKLE